MRHVPEGRLRRLVDEPFAVADSRRRPRGELPTLPPAPGADLPGRSHGHVAAVPTTVGSRISTAPGGGCRPQPLRPVPPTPRSRRLRVPGRWRWRLVVIPVPSTGVLAMIAVFVVAAAGAAALTTVLAPITAGARPDISSAASKRSPTSWASTEAPASSAASTPRPGRATCPSACCGGRRQARRFAWHRSPRREARDGSRSPVPTTLPAGVGQPGEHPGAAAGDGDDSIRLRRRATRRQDRSRSPPGRRCWSSTAPRRPRSGAADARHLRHGKAGGLVNGFEGSSTRGLRALTPGCARRSRTGDTAARRRRHRPSLANSARGEREPGRRQRLAGHPRHRQFRRRLRRDLGGSWRCRPRRGRAARPEGHSRCRQPARLSSPRPARCRPCRRASSASVETEGSPGARHDAGADSRSPVSPAIHTIELRKQYPRTVALRGAFDHCAAWGDLRLPRPERRRQDDGRQAPARPRPSHRRRGDGARGASRRRRNASPDRLPAGAVPVPKLADRSRSPPVALPVASRAETSVECRW